MGAMDLDVKAVDESEAVLASARRGALALT